MVFKDGVFGGDLGVLGLFLLEVDCRTSVTLSSESLLETVWKEEDLSLFLPLLSGLGLALAFFTPVGEAHLSDALALR
jgi:hypothetical protein